MPMTVDHLQQLLSAVEALSRSYATLRRAGISESMLDPLWLLIESIVQEAGANK